jgi:hypothetical protein
MDKIDPAVAVGEDYSKEHYAAACEWMKTRDPDFHPSKYETIFIDSITVASRLCRVYAEQHPGSLTKQGEFNKLGMYGVIKEEMTSWATRLQRIPDKNVWMVGLLDRREDDAGNTLWEPQLEGGGFGKNLPGIVDQVITMTELKTRGENDTVKSRRAFVCQKINHWGYPAKNRGGALSLIEPAHLGKLMEKIKQGAEYNPHFDYSAILEDEVIY